MSDTLETTDAMTDESFAAAMEAKYAGEDAAHVDASDDMDEGGEQEDGSTATSSTDDEDDAEHTAAGTSEDRDGDTSESDEESADDDDAEHPDDAEASDESAESAKSTEGGEAEATKEEEEDPETAIAEDTKALLAAKGADLKLDDVPAEYRPIVEKKLRGIDQAFSRAQQELTSYRSERAQFLAEQQFQKEHPELLIADLLRQHPELEAKTLEASPDPDDAAAVTAFDKKVAEQRKAAKDAVEAEHQAAYEANVRAHQRADEAVATALRLSAEAGIPFELVEPALILAVKAKPEGQQDLTDEEMAAVIAKAARALNKPVRQQLRQQSKERVRKQTAVRTAQVAPRAAATASRPATPVPPKKKVDVSNPDALEAAMFESARRIIPGAR